MIINYRRIEFFSLCCITFLYITYRLLLLTPETILDITPDYYYFIMVYFASGNVSRRVRPSHSVHTTLYYYYYKQIYTLTHVHVRHIIIIRFSWTAIEITLGKYCQAQKRNIFGIRTLFYIMYHSQTLIMIK